MKTLIAKSKEEQERNIRKIKKMKMPAKCIYDSGKYIETYYNKAARGKYKLRMDRPIPDNI